MLFTYSPEVKWPMIKSHLGASTTPQAAHTEGLYKQTPLSFYVKGKHQKASRATLENHPEGSNGDLGRRASGFITTARRAARPPAVRARGSRVADPAGFAA